MNDYKYLVSAIVSVYNCERFIEGCLEDLENQTIADKIEIVIVNSGSQQNEESIIKRFQERYRNIVYLKTQERETIYAAWNRGIKASSGKYITNANSDDRHCRNAFEIMTSVLEYSDNVGLVYGDSIITKTENETFDNCTPIGYIDYSLDILDRASYLLYGGVGNQPMWRKEIHDEFGYFDNSLEVAGDIDFWLRISKKIKFKHIKRYLGLSLNLSSSMEHKNFELTAIESLEVAKRYLPEIKLDKEVFIKWRRILSRQCANLALFYIGMRKNSAAINMLLKAIYYNWWNLKAYKLLAATLIPYDIRKHMQRGRQ